ncbi:DNA-3-methyladenine glycosylase family protein [Tepidamorphus sp. 3E244]|uniref:DNA-3-methyladenine glycosylase family protein n=1 Tax=Tepidamorphus sp. 3E244 TaxID=3385498 RepID=UPI0038FCB4FB
MTTPITHFKTQRDLAEACERLGARDEAMARLVTLCGVPPLRQREAGFSGLAAIVTGQQVSTAAARAIWDRVIATLGRVDPQAIEAASDETLGIACGLSRAKVRTLRAMAGAVQDGTLDFARLETLENDAVHATLTALPGIGPWTADVYLLFCLRRADAWPAGDLAVVEAVRMLRGLDERPRGAEAIACADGWRPYRGAAAHLLWAYYALEKGRAGAPVAQTS